MTFLLFLNMLSELYAELYTEQYTEQYAEQYQRIFLYIVPLNKYCSFRGQKYIPKCQFGTLGLGFGTLELIYTPPLRTRFPRRLI